MALRAETVNYEHQDMTAGAHFDRPVDLVHLARYTLGNRSLEREVLELFRTQSAIYLKRMKEAGGDKDWADAAHTIKGSARGIGAWHVARIAEAAEALTGRMRKSGNAEVVQELERLIGEANSYIESLLAETGADEDAGESGS